jgi:hypothetical protein
VHVQALEWKAKSKSMDSPYQLYLPLIYPGNRPGFSVISPRMRLCCR